MGSSKKTFLTYIYLIILYINIYKVWCNPIENCERYLKSWLGNNNAGLEVFTFLFNNGNPNITRNPNGEIIIIDTNFGPYGGNLDLNVEPDNFSEDVLIELNNNLHCYINDLQINVNVTNVNVPTIIKFCKLHAESKYEWSMATYGYWDHEYIIEDCRNTIKNFLQIEDIKLSRQKCFNQVFQLILNHANFNDDGILLKLKNAMLKGATTPKAVQSVLDVNIFCIYRYTQQFQKLISHKRIKLENNSDGTPNYEIVEKKPRSRQNTSTSSSQNQNIDD